MKKVLIYVLALPLLQVLGCGEETRPAQPAPPSTEDLVIANCYLLQQAAEAFAAENNGQYPVILGDGIPPNKTFPKDFLPGGVPLENPYTGEAEPSGPYAFHTGQTGYRYVANRWYINAQDPTGYVITGFGYSKQIITVTNLPDSLVQLDEEVIANGYAVQAAAEAFAAENNGVYPSDVYYDQTPAGNSLIELLPGGTFLRNPYTEVPSEPMDGVAMSPGQTGYTRTVQGGENVGYTITGFASLEMLFTIKRSPSYCPEGCIR